MDPSTIFINRLRSTFDTIDNLVSNKDFISNIEAQKEVRILYTKIFTDIQSINNLNISNEEKDSYLKEFKGRMKRIREIKGTAITNQDDQQINKELHIMGDNLDHLRNYALDMNSELRNQEIIIENIDHVIDNDNRRIIILNRNVQRLGGSNKNRLRLIFLFIAIIALVIVVSMIL